MKLKLAIPTIALTVLLSLLLRADEKGVYLNSIQLSPADTEQEIILKAGRIVPTANQLAWQEMEYIAFAHFGMNTFTNKEWGNGKEDPKLFNPTALDARQWVGVLQAAGFKELIITAKHHDGFCLWPSKYTEHSVKNSPWKNGQGDVVKELAEACHEAGLKFGVYLSPWDRHEKTYGAPAYNDYYKNQLRELLTNYGEVSEVWFDGAGTGKKWKQMQGLYDWQGYFNLAHELQPQAVVFNERGDVRWVGNEAGKGRPSEWSVAPEKYSATDPDIGSRLKLIEAAKQGLIIRWLPAEVDTSIRPGWFYHKQEDRMVKSLSRLVDIYFNAVGGNAVLLLNIPPDRRGLINENDATRLIELRKYLDETFAQNLARDAKINSSSQPGGDSRIEYDLGRPMTFNIALIQEQIKLGQRVEEFFLDAWDGKDWNPIAKGAAIGYKRILRFNPVTTPKVRVRVTQSRDCPTLSNFELYLSPQEKMAP